MYESIQGNNIIMDVTIFMCFAYLLIVFMSNEIFVAINSVHIGGILT